MIIDDAAAQLTDELGRRLHALAALDGPAAVLAADAQTGQIVGRIVGALCSEDDRLAAEAVIDLMAALWPDGTEPPHDWWSSPVGRIVARSIGADDAEAVTQSVAAAMLRVTRGTIAQLVARGTLDRHPDGGVLRSSVMQRLATRGR